MVPDAAKPLSQRTPAGFARLTLMTTVIVHGAGSTTTTACALLGIAPSPDVVPIEDRSGDVDSVVDLIDSSVGKDPSDLVLVGVSLGAHAIARWAAERARTGRPPVQALICVLPAWVGAPSNAAAATAASARAIAAHGITRTLRDVETRQGTSDVLSLLHLAWADYSDEGLAAALHTASQGKAPDLDDLTVIREPLAVVGWHADPLHPADIARVWAKAAPRATCAMAARPDTRLLRAALRTARGADPESS